MKIFLVDDEPMIIMAISAILMREGYSVDTATDSREALARVSANLTSYDILICDQRMPHLYGVELIEKLRTVGFAGKILIHAGAVERDDEAKMEALGVDAILTKPVPMVTFTDTIQRLARSTSSTSVSSVVD